MSLLTISDWIYQTPISNFIRETHGLIPTVQSTHIVAISVLVGSAMTMDLRLANVLARDEAPEAIVRRHLPWQWGALTLLLITGLTLVVGEPDRTVTNNIFWWKMGLVLAAFILSLLFRKPVLKPDFSIDQTRWAGLVKPLAWLSLLIWIGVIFCGRWIAYAV